MTITTMPKRLGEACKLTPILAEMRNCQISSLTKVEKYRKDECYGCSSSPACAELAEFSDRIEKAVIEDLIDASTTCYMTLYKPVCDMREAQKEYFKTRSADALARAKKLEREVDAILVRMLAVDEPEQGELPL